MNDAVAYNPLDKANLGKSVAEALLENSPRPIDKIQSFQGAGIYAIYYTGTFAAYRVISDQNKNNKFEAPQYVGKAVPPGARKGGFGLSADPGNVLFKRILEHADSINRVKNLNVSDFHCRYLVVDDIWIPLGESMLIAKFSPLWNTSIDGFGNHDPGKGRYQQVRSRWDVLHPGREWAERCQPRSESDKQIISEIKAFLKS